MPGEDLSLVPPFAGIWSNLFAASLQDSLYWSSDPSQFWDRWAQDQANLGKCLGFSVGERWAASWECLKHMALHCFPSTVTTETGVKDQRPPFPKVTLVASSILSPVQTKSRFPI